MYIDKAQCIDCNKIHRINTWNGNGICAFQIVGFFLQLYRYSFISMSLSCNKRSAHSFLESIEHET